MKYRCYECDLTAISSSRYFIKCILEGFYRIIALLQLHHGSHLRLYETLFIITSFCVFRGILLSCLIETTGNFLTYPKHDLSVCGGLRQRALNTRDDSPIRACHSKGIVLIICITFIPFFLFGCIGY